MRRLMLCTASVMAVALTLGLDVQAGAAQDRGHEHGQAQDQVERQREPLGYQRSERPSGVDARPADLDTLRANHNFNAARTFRIGAYNAPAGWTYSRWRSGDILPPAFWVRQYWLTDFWLFGLDVPPVGYEWVRYGSDALMVDSATGRVVQAVYGAFL